MSADDPPPHADTNGSPDPSILTPIPPPNNINNIHDQNQTPPPATSPSVQGFTLPNNREAEGGGKGEEG
ncbi:hypothetical protein ACJ72_08556 [Emergomyces africanus]|uniref:Uncharacterized protein n=1 Tax=Emergomyces africanus TaxID=1955775 RepID=A0A1B7NK08_9EURO|nr:hypothetical protein ACJ72_08556 [Emergomyces africanus]